MRSKQKIQMHQELGQDDGYDTCRIQTLRLQVAQVRAIDSMLIAQRRCGALEWGRDSAIGEQNPTGQGVHYQGTSCGHQ